MASREKVLEFVVKERAEAGVSLLQIDNGTLFYWRYSSPQRLYTKNQDGEEIDAKLPEVTINCDGSHGDTLYFSTKIRIFKTVFTSSGRVEVTYVRNFLQGENDTTGGMLNRMRSDGKKYAYGMWDDPETGGIVIEDDDATRGMRLESTMRSNAIFLTRNKGGPPTLRRLRKEAVVLEIPAPVSTDDRITTPFFYFSYNTTLCALNTESMTVLPPLKINCIESIDSFAGVNDGVATLRVQMGDSRYIVTAQLPKEYIGKTTPVPMRAAVKEPTEKDEGTNQVKFTEVEELPNKTEIFQVEDGTFYYLSTNTPNEIYVNYQGERKTIQFSGCLFTKNDRSEYAEAHGNGIFFETNNIRYKAIFVPPRMTAHTVGKDSFPRIKGMFRTRPGLFEDVEHEGALISYDDQFNLCVHTLIGTVKGRAVYFIVRDKWDSTFEMRRLKSFEYPTQDALLITITSHSMSHFGPTDSNPYAYFLDQRDEKLFVVDASTMEWLAHLPITGLRDHCDISRIVGVHNGKISVSGYKKLKDEGEEMKKIVMTAKLPEGYYLNQSNPLSREDFNNMKIVTARF